MRCLFMVARIYHRQVVICISHLFSTIAYLSRLCLYLVVYFPRKQVVFARTCEPGAVAMPTLSLHLVTVGGVTKAVFPIRYHAYCSLGEPNACVL